MLSNVLQGLAHEMDPGGGLRGVVVILPVDRRTEVGEAALNLASAGGGGLALQPAVVVEELVLRDPPQPAAERVARRAFLEAVQAGGDALKDLLEYVCKVRLRQPPPPAPLIDQRRVHPHEPIPGVGVPGAGTLQQAARCRTDAVAQVTTHQPVCPPPKTA